MTRVGAVEVPTPMLDKMGAPDPRGRADRMIDGVEVPTPCKLHDHSQMIHDFLEALHARGIRLAKIGEPEDEWGGALWQPIYRREEDARLAAFFGVDRQAMEDEKRALLEAIRASAS